jgi:DNA-binding transcriptional ArsR family regulator
MNIMVVAHAVHDTDVSKASSCCVTPGIRSAVISEAEADTYAGCFRALADPTRIRIIDLLAQQGEPVCVCEIVDRFPLGQSTISHHLKILREVRFVFAERRGTFMYYQVNHACLSALPDAVQRMLHL